MIGLTLGAAGFLTMEGVSYASHRWLMHRVGMVWHRSHHRPSDGGWEANDLFPAMFSLIGFVLFVLAVGIPWLRPVAIGVTAYGAAYLFVHKVYIHRRLRWRLPGLAYLEHLREAGAGSHHRFGGEPYGMLLPVVPRELRERAAQSSKEADLARRSSTRPPTRSRL